MVAKRLELHQLLKQHWLIILDLDYPAKTVNEFKNGSKAVRVTRQNKINGEVWTISIQWIAGERKGKLVLSTEIDNLINQLKNQTNVVKGS